MAVGYTRQSTADIVTGLVVEAQPVNDEFDSIEAFAAVAGGHNHDGTAGGGAPINLVTSVTGTLGLDRGGTNANLTGIVAGASVVGGSGCLAWVKNNLAGTTTPTVSNDSSQGYALTSLWLYVPSGRIYMCTNAGVGVASWTELNDATAVGAALGKFKISSTDTTTDYAKNKLTATAPLNILQTNTGAAETLNFSIALANATTTLTGILALATTGAVSTGTETTTAVTPAGINEIYVRKTQTATETLTGVIELATVDEAHVGSDVSRAVTPAGLHKGLKYNITPLNTIGALYTTVAAGTTAGAIFTRYKITGTATLTLPSFGTDNEWVIVEFAATNGTTMTVGRNAQTIDGTAADDTCTTKGPIVLYYRTGSGAVESKLIGSVPD